MADSTFVSFYLRYDTVHIFCDALRKIGRPEYIRFLVNENSLQMVMQAHDKKEFISFRVPKALYGHQYGTRKRMHIRSKAFCQLLAAKMGWEPTKSYRIPGIIFPSQNLVRYDLALANEIQVGSESSQDDTIIALHQILS